MALRPRNSTPTRSRAGAKPRTTEPPAQAARISELLAATWPDATCELDHRNAYELLVATILAAQSTDKMINTLTPALFAKYPNATALAGADPAGLEALVHSSGFYRMKAKHLLGMARAVVERHGGEIPDTMDALVALPGVARKTANVVLGTALGKNEGVVVDTHVTRLAQRLGLTSRTEPVAIEQDLMRLLPRDQWTSFAHRLIIHGRRVCGAQRPDCDHCSLAPACPSAGLAAAEVGRPPRPSPRAQFARGRANKATPARARAKVTAKPARAPARKRSRA
jgi:endonuclease-3